MTGSAHHWVHGLLDPVRLPPLLPQPRDRAQLLPATRPHSGVLSLCRRYVRATDLTRLPPAFVSVSAIDGFRDEDVDYAVRLNQAGVPCELHVYPGVPHGYQMAQATTVVRRAAGHIEDWLSAQLAADGAK